MAYHVEIGQGNRTAREFNLDAARLSRLVLQPWARGQEIRLGDREWLPAECRLMVVEGPELSPPDLAFGRGWDRAIRAGRNVTRELVAEAARAVSAIAVLAESASAREAIVTALGELGLRGVDWAASRASALEARSNPSGPGSAEAPIAVVLGLEGADPTREWLFEAGVAVGALSGRALVVLLGSGEAPPALAGLASVGPSDDLSQVLAGEFGRLGSPS